MSTASDVAGQSGYGWAGFGAAWFGRRGQARPGEVGLGPVRRGGACQGRLGSASHGQARCGGFRLGAARWGGAWQGSRGAARRVWVWPVRAGSGSARQAGYGMSGLVPAGFVWARRGLARPGLAGVA